MIFFISDGRMGNQLFQYAFLKTVAKNKEVVCCVNMNQFCKYFDIENSTFYQISAGKITFLFIKNFISKILSFLVKLKVIGSINQLKFSGVPQPKSIKKKGVLPFYFVDTGFFQSELFFLKSEVDFKIKKQYQLRATEIVESLPKNEKVFIHVRRGDYVFESYAGIRGIELPSNYYFDAMQRIEKTVENPFYIFLTDDPGYVKDFFKDLKNKYISEENMAVDFAIMGMCNYGVGSNSSFSWWGSYFSKEKVHMIFPQYWYGWKTKVESHPLIQPSWSEVISPCNQFKE